MNRKILEIKLEEREKSGLGAVTFTPEQFGSFFMLSVCLGATMFHFIQVLISLDVISILISLSVNILIMYLLLKTFANVNRE